MGRYWETDNGETGKFCFGEQPSNAPEMFGMYEDQNRIRYVIEKEDFNIDKLQELFDKDNIDMKVKDLTEDDIIKLKEKNFEENNLSCDTFLGLSIYLDCLLTDYCILEAEI